MERKFENSTRMLLLPVLLIGCAALTAGQGAATDATAEQPSAVVIASSTPLPPPELASLTINGSTITPADSAAIELGSLDPGDYELRLVIQGGGDGTFRIGGQEAQAYNIALGTGVADVPTTLNLAATLEDPSLPLVLIDALGQTMSYQLTFTPGPRWAPHVLIPDPTTVTGDATLTIMTAALKGSQSQVASLNVSQEVNPQASGNKATTEYISNQPLGNLTFTKRTESAYTLSFHTDWPGRFPLKFVMTTTDGRTIETRIPIDVRWPSQRIGLRGVAISAYWDPWFDYEPVLNNLAAAHVNAIELNPIWFIPDRTSTEIRPWPEVWASGNKGNTISDESITKLIRSAKSRGMTVFLKPMIEFDNYTEWRGGVSPTDWSAWFTSYRTFIVHYAKIAQAEGVPYFCVGAELRNATSHTDEWRAVIAAVRNVYSGKITYSDSELLPGNSTVEFWDALDYIGMPMYYPSNGSYWGSDDSQIDPTVDQIQASIDANFTKIVEPVVAKYQKPVMVTEVGVPHYDGASIYPWIWNASGDLRLDNQEQVDYYEAAMRVINQKSYVQGMFWWETVLGAGHANAATSPASYDPYGLPATDVLSVWFR